MAQATKKRKIFLKLIVVFLLLGTSVYMCNGFFSPKRTNRVKSNPNYENKLADTAAFRSFAGTPLVAKYNGVSTVKLVLELSNQRLYYIKSSRYTYHFDFCEEILGFQGGLALFNQTNYSNTRLRKYALANLNFYPTLNAFALEFVTEDDILPEYINQVYQAVVKSSFINKNFFVLVNGELLQEKVTHLPQLPLLYPNDIYATLSYQAIVNGSAYGQLIFVEDGKHFMNYREDGIYVVKGSPLLIPPCQGIITDQFQTPLSHIQVLAHNKRMPSFAYKNIWSEEYKKFNNQWVHVVITADSFSIKPTPEAEAKKFVRHGLTETIKLNGNIEYKGIQPLTTFKFRDKNKIGNKAANLAVLEKLGNENKKLFRTPEGSFAIPFGYYYQHVQDTIIAHLIQDLLLHKSDWTLEKIQSTLKSIRKEIVAKPLDPVCLRMVEKQIQVNGQGSSYRFRSSGNAEDAAGFSGAGLYESKTGILGDSNKSIEKAIKKVWASTWNLEAFLAREQAHIQQQQVLMAVLCHRNFPEEEANGVVVTRNIYRPSFPGFTVNVQWKEISVVQPDSNVQCDQFTFFKPADFNPFTDDIAVDYIAYGNQHGGQPVLTPAQVKTLYKAIALCDAYFAEHQNAGVSYDLEFKFDQGLLYLKQIRPYY